MLFNYDAFSGTGVRTGTLTVNGLTLTVSQTGTDYLVAPFRGAVRCWWAAPRNPGCPRWTVAATSFSQTWRNPTPFLSGMPPPPRPRFWPQPLPATTLTESLWTARGNVYYALNDVGQLVKWTASTQQVSTLASGLNGPTGVAVDAAGNVYVSEGTGNTLKVWSSSTQQVTTVIGNGLSNPQGLATDLSGNVYIADTLNGAIKRYSPSTGQTTTLVGSHNNPTGVAVDGQGNVYFADYYGTAGFRNGARPRRR